MMRWLYLTGFLAICGTFLADVFLPVDYRIAANTTLIVLAGLVTVFTLLYGIRSRWRSNPIGKIFLVKGVFLAAVLWQIVVAQWIDTEYPFRQQIRFVIYAGGAVAYIVMLASLWRLQQRDRRGLRFPNGIGRALNTSNSRTNPVESDEADGCWKHRDGL